MCRNCGSRTRSSHARWYGSSARTTIRAPSCSRPRLGRDSDPAVGEELGVVALAGLGLGDLLGRVELREVDDLDVVAGPLECVLVDERPGGVDAHGPREAD